MEQMWKSFDHYKVLHKGTSQPLGSICAILLISSKVNGLPRPKLLRGGFVKLLDHFTAGKPLPQNWGRSPARGSAPETKSKGRRWLRLKNKGIWLFIRDISIDLRQADELITLFYWKIFLSEYPALYGWKQSILFSELCKYLVNSSPPSPPPSSPHFPI